MASNRRDNRKRGKHYEALAAHFLEQQGLVLIERNVHVRIGEIDLIFRDQNTWIFVEVKYRKTSRYGSAVEAISYHKQKRWHQAAQIWLQQQNLTEHEWDCRFDLVAIDGEPAQITWLPNILLEQ